MNTDIQNYRGLKLRLNNRSDYNSKRAKEYIVISPKGFDTDCKIWIPNSFLYEDGTINLNKNFMFIFNKKDIALKLFGAGYEFTY